MLNVTPRMRTSKGFTLVELAVVIVIIGVLAAFGVPRYLKSVERSKSAEAFAYLTTIRSAQERYHAQHSIYAQDQWSLDVQSPSPKYFSVGNFNPGDSGNFETSWSLTLTRQGASSGYGAYTVIFNQNGYDYRSTIPGDITPMQN